LLPLNDKDKSVIDKIVDTVKDAVSAVTERAAPERFGAHHADLW
jgi:hypothetical protein